MLLKYIRTKRFLQEIAKHLAPYTTYSKAEYVCEITNKHIWVLPEIRIFPNRYNRRDADREPVVDHVMQKHFPDCVKYVEGPAKKEKVYNAEKFQMGRYVYKLSADKKRRKWIRIA